MKDEEDGFSVDDTTIEEKETNNKTNVSIDGIEEVTFGDHFESVELSGVDCNANGDDVSKFYSKSWDRLKDMAVKNSKKKIT